MKKCVILCAGEIAGSILPLQPEDLLIAADGGFRHAESLGLTPHIILGDFDSLGFVPQGAVVYPKEKDDTDAMLAVRLGLSEGYRAFYLYGAMDGPRVDHTMANFQLLHFLADAGARGYLMGTHQIATAVNDQISFPAGKKGNVSVFCLGKDAKVTIQGLKYELQEGLLQAAFPLGVSNQFLHKEASITVKEGTVLVIWDKEEEK